MNLAVWRSGRGGGSQIETGWLVGGKPESKVPWKARDEFIRKEGGIHSAV